jgi:protein-S-isoprenylcysteine O-methyltransferase Ste14
MSDTADTAQVIIRPPIAWALAVLAGLALKWLMPLPFVPGMLPAGWLGATVFALALVLVAWAIATMTRTGSNVPTSLPTTTIVETGPYRFTRNPIYLGMFLGSPASPLPSTIFGCWRRSCPSPSSFGLLHCADSCAPRQHRRRRVDRI